MSKANYSLRLQRSLKAAAERLALVEGTILKHFINVAVAEKLAALETEQFFKDRAPRCRPRKLHAVSRRILRRAANRGRPPGCSQVIVARTR